MPAPVHPGRLLRRELKARELSANRLAIDLGVPSGHITDILNGRRSVTPIPRCGSAAISATARNSGSTCKANMILRSSSASGAQRSRSGCGQQARPDSSGCGAAYAPSIVLGGFEVTSGPASGASSNRN